MIDYQAIADRSAPVPQRILLKSKQFGPSDLAGHIPLPADGPLPQSLRDAQPDILIIDADEADSELAGLLDDLLFADLPVILLAADGDADGAGLLLGARVTAFLPRDAHPDALEAAIADIARPRHVADAGTRFEADERIAALRRDAERVAAALADLATDRAHAGDIRPVDASRIRAHIKARRVREKFFEPELFADPAWDMLLDLSAARLEGRQVSVSSLCIAAAVPTTTALRWIKTLIDRGMLDRTSDPTDARRAFIAMTSATAATMTKCLEASLNLPGQ